MLMAKMIIVKGITNKPGSESQLQQIQKRALLSVPETMLTFECPNANDEAYEGSKILLGA